MSISVTPTSTVREKNDKIIEQINNSGIKVSGSSAEQIFILNYRNGSIVDKLYFSDISLEEAIETGKSYCNNNPRRKFIFVTPFLTDLKFKIKEELK